MKTLIALHGNPGAPEDWDILASHLDSKNFQLKAFDSYGSEWLDEVRRGSDKKILIAHSWGSYPILKNLNAIAPKVEKVILACPYAKPEKVLSALAGILLKTPVIGEALIKSSHKKMRDVFVAEMIHPCKLADHLYYQKLQDRFADWTRWQKAAFAKLEMQKDPWQSSWVVDLPLVLLFGSEDRTSTLENQNLIFKNYPNITIKIIPKAGHGILWSHPHEIISALR